MANRTKTNIGILKNVYGEERMFTQYKEQFEDSNEHYIIEASDIDPFDDTIEFKVPDKALNEFGNYIIGLGRLTKQKNFKLLIKAFSKIDFIRDTKLIIAGDGEEKRFLNKLI